MMCYYLNVHFQGQRVKSALEIWRKSVEFIWLRTDAIYGPLWTL